jgi:hypothetical protein
VTFTFCGQLKRLDQDAEYDKLWKVWLIADTVNEIYAKFHSLSKQLPVNKVTVQFKGSHFHATYFKERKCFGTQLINCVKIQGILT